MLSLLLLSSSLSSPPIPPLLFPSPPLLLPSSHPPLLFTFLIQRVSSDQYLVVRLPKEWSVVTAGKDVRNHKNGWFWNSSEEYESVSCPACGMGWGNVVGRDFAPPSPIQLQWLDFCSIYAIFLVSGFVRRKRFESWVGLKMLMQIRHLIYKWGHWSPER